MTITTRISISLFTLSVCLGLQGQALSQSRETNSKPNSEPQVELIASTNPISIEEVVFEGLHAVDESDLRKAFREQRAGLAKNSGFDYSNVEKGTSILKQLLADAGFMNASVDVRIVDISAKSKRIVFVVDEGPPAVIREIKFEGNKVFSDDELRSQLQLFTEMSHDVYDRARLEYDLNNPRNFMRSRGYLQARILERKVTSLNGNVTIVIPVEEGKLFHIGEITVLGSNRFSPEQIVGIIDLKKGDVADGKRINDALFDELKKIYANMGYPQYFAEVDPEFRDNPNHENEGVVDLQITITEGICFKVAYIEFKGNKKLSAKELRRFLVFKEGDTYNEQLIQDSIRNLNESELLEPLGFESDIDFKTDEDLGLIKIIFKVQEYED